MLLNVPVVFLRAHRATVVVAYLKYRVPFRVMIPVQLVGQVSSTISPAASGDFVRAYLWRRYSGVPLRVGAATVAFERLYSLFLLTALSVLLITLPRHRPYGWFAVAAGLVLATFAPLLFELLPTSLERWVLGKLARGRFLGRYADGAQGMFDQFRLIMRAPLLLVWTSFITVAIAVVLGAQVWLVIKALGFTVPITQAVAAHATSQVAGIISTLPFGIGSADAALVTLFAGYGVTVTLAATVAVLLRGVNTIPLVLAGLVGYLMVQKPSAQPDLGVESGAAAAGGAAEIP